ncbi:hypothetical protein QP027_11550 [Corynebacterium breve]|uniref:DUF2267 domain-containing protein n=1 Tax=Corynebacterium breve TaxID=3049799 RepID=A0ABY8VDF8_9CORY|nr:hypothetical protein [Corynebacterium breve]WIM67696.1 hypothetical protein QP027_11550 [Corynebacterium breve]
MPELSTLLNEEKRPQVVAELAKLAEDTVSNASGLTGIALKGGVGAAKKMDANIVTTGLDRILPDALGELQPYWTEYIAGEKSGFGPFLAQRDTEVADALLAVGDRAAENAPAAATKIYSGLRGKAQGIIAPVVPQLGELLEKHMA